MRDFLQNSNTSSEETDSDYYEEPLHKYPRLSDKDHSYSFRNNTTSPIEDDSGHNHELSEQTLESEDVMNENGKYSTKSGGEDIVDGNFFRFGEDTSQFTRSVFDICLSWAVV